MVAQRVGSRARFDLGTGTTYTIDPTLSPIGSAVAEGDLIFASVVSYSGTALRVPTMTGWTTIVPFGATSTGARGLYCRKRLAGDTTYTDTMGSGTNNTLVDLFWVRNWSGNISELVIGSLYTRPNGAAIATNAAPSITTTVANTAAMLWSYEKSSTAKTIDNTSVDNDFVEDLFYGGTASFSTTYVAFKTLATPGAVGTTTATYNGTHASNGSALLVGIPPAGVIIPPTPTVAGLGCYTLLPDKVGIGGFMTNPAPVFARATPVGGGAAVDGPTATPASSGAVYATVPGLPSGVKYTVQLRVASDSTVIGTCVGRTVSTVPRDLVVLTSSCQRSNSNTTGWNALAAEGADFFVHQGDLHYADTADQAVWRAAFKAQLTASNMAAFLGTLPTSYHYDNHDWGGNTSWRESPCAAFVPTAIREVMGDQFRTQGMESTWVEGGVRFIETDQYAYRDEAMPTPLDNTRVGKTMLGLTQRQWLFDTLEAATEPLIVWFCSFPLYGNYVANGRWGSFRDEAAIIDAWLIAHPEVKSKIVCVGGDSHNVVADDGTNTMWGLPSLNASPIDRVGDTAPVVSATWNIVNNTNDMSQTHYSKLDFQWDGDAVEFTWRARRSDGVTEATWSRTFQNEVPVEPVSVSIDIGGIQRTGTLVGTVKDGAIVPLQAP